MLRTAPLRLSALALLAHAAAAQGIAFEDLSARSGLVYGPDPAAAALAVGDIDGDGWQDVVISGRVAPRIFRNQGAAVLAGQAQRWFVDVTAHWMPADAEPASMALLGDLDNDGDQDLVVARQFWSDVLQGWNENETAVGYYENVGGAFVRGNSDPDLGRWNRGYAGLSLADMDVDGDLDIVFVHKGSAALGAPQGPGFYIRNDGLPDLVDATAEAGGGLDVPRRHLGLLVADFSGDLLPDVHTAIDQFSDYHAHNLGGGKLADVTQAVGATHLGSDMGLAEGDVENDGDIDIFSTNIGEGVLYLNDGQGNFVNDAGPRGIGLWQTPSLCIGWGTVFADVDHDMDQDLVVVGQQHPGLLFVNDGLGYFSDGTAASGLVLEGRSLVHFDFDRDGDLDLLVGDNAVGHPVLYRARSSATRDRHWLIVDPQGTSDNREGVAARIEVSAGGVTQTRVIVAGSSFHSAPPTLAHFGLGDATEADVVRVTWPSGQVQVLEHVEADRYLVVVQP